MRRLVKHHALRHPRDMGEREALSFLRHMAVNLRLAAATQSQALAAILFLYKHVVDRPLSGLGEIPRPRAPTRRPVVLTPDEVRRVLSHLHDDTKRSISAIVMWELAKLVQLGRVDLDLDDPEVIRLLSSLHVWPVDLAVRRKSTDLDFHGDPADELIAATSIVHSVPLVARDRVIRNSKLVPLAL